MSWNVDGLRAPGRLDDLAVLVANEAPDLLVLQETKLQAPWTENWQAAMPGYDAYWSHRWVRSDINSYVARLRCQWNSRAQILRLDESIDLLFIFVLDAKYPLMYITKLLNNSKRLCHTSRAFMGSMVPFRNTYNDGSLISMPVLSSARTRRATQEP